LLKDGVDEISRRHGTYLSHAPVASGAFRRTLEEYRKLPRYRAYTPAMLDELSERCRRGLTDLGVAQDARAPQLDLVGRILLEVGLDALAAERGELPLRAAPPPDTASLPAVVAAEFDERQSSRGVRYLIRRRGSKPLVLITATGIAGSVWTRLLADSTHDFRIVIVESRTADYVRGEMRNSCALEVDSADIEQVLALERLTGVAVIGWCNGCSVAVDLAARVKERIDAVVLLCPTLWSHADGTPVSPYQAEMRTVFEAVARRPEIAATCATMFREEAAKKVDVASSSEAVSPTDLLCLPAAGLINSLAAPTSNPDELVHYARRMVSDAAFQVGSKLAGVASPVLVITGTHDHIVNDTYTRKTLSRVPSISGFATVTGAGHYIQDLQYSYFRWLLESFVPEGALPQSTARIRISSPPVR
jgi:pimeloyl-ACP methyl ester carboxylesterase